MVIENYTALQEKSMKDKADEKAREKTNSAMDLLRNHSSSTTRSSPSSSSTSTSTTKEGEENGNELVAREKTTHGVVDLAMLIQITEFKCAIKTMTEQLIQTNNQTDKDKMGNISCSSSSSSGSTQIIQKLDEITTFLKNIENKFIPTKTSTTLASHGKTVEEVPVQSNDKKQDDDVLITNLKKKPEPELESSVQDLSDGKVNLNDDSTKTGEESTTQPNILQNEPVPKEKDISTTTTNNKESNDVVETKEQSSTTKDTTTQKPTIGKEASNDEKTTNEAKVGKEALLDALQKMQSSNEMDLIKPCAQMLILYTTNLSANPKSKQYRKIFTSSKTYKNKVGNVEFAKDVLYAVGFVDEGKSFLEWKNDSEMETAIVLLKEAASLLKKIKAGESIDGNGEDVSTA